MKSKVGLCNYQKPLIRKYVKWKRSGKNEEAQVLGMGDAFLPWNDILHRLQAQINTGRFEDDKYRINEESGTFCRRSFIWNSRS